MYYSILEKLKKLAAQKAWCDNDNFNALDYSDGNFDDTYDGGFRDGEIQLAREILAELNVKRYSHCEQGFAIMDTKQVLKADF
jgi:hypothetical protein